MQIIKLAWVGTRTENFEPTVKFFRDVLGLRPDFDLPGFQVLKLPDGSKVEVFGSDTEMNRHFTTGPVVGFSGRRCECGGQRAAGSGCRDSPYGG